MGAGPGVDLAAKFDPLRAFIKSLQAQAPPARGGAADRYNPLASLARVQAPPPRAAARAAGSERFDVVGAALDAVAGLEVPRRGDGGASWDPVAWLLDAAAKAQGAPPQRRP